jgi:hypothetical protein
MPEGIRAQDTQPTPALVAANEHQSDTSVVRALRRELHAQKAHYQAELAKLKTQLKQREQALAAAHGEIQRLSKRR